jgi:hypothetical protein
VSTHWSLGYTSNKLPFFSEDFIFGKSDNDPRLAVVARRLDSPAPLVWSDWANGSIPIPQVPELKNPDQHGFMVTSLPIPTVGCWEITAHYTPARDKSHTLTYTVWVGP